MSIVQVRRSVVAALNNVDKAYFLVTEMNFTPEVESIIANALLRAYTDLENIQMAMGEIRKGGAHSDESRLWLEILR